MDKKELAKQSAIARSKTAPAQRAQTNAGGRPALNKQNQLAFFSEEAAGLKLSPKTVLIISLIYMGLVVLLHIFGKVKSTTGAADGRKDL